MKILTKIMAVSMFLLVFGFWLIGTVSPAYSNDGKSPSTLSGIETLDENVTAITKTATNKFIGFVRLVAFVVLLGCVFVLILSHNSNKVGYTFIAMGIVFLCWLVFEAIAAGGAESLIRSILGWFGADMYNPTAN